ncbi:lamin tail domain-containing protein [Croceimicrobium sp.]|uniref:lamin tail domain-containing protein n=1 Tax=Croceimicrobium sp. TaxID=2828340 RepID=UPI003BAD6691
MRKIFTLACLLFLGIQTQAQLVINEVLYDPSNNALDGDANGDGSYDQEGDSFIELYNSSSTNFDISGYQIWDDTTSGNLKFVFPANTWVPPHGVIVVFGSGPLVGNFGGAIVLSADTSADGLNLNNSGEVIAIRDANGTTVLTFDSDALSNNPNESYTRNPDITGAFEQHNDNFSVLFSPGTRVDGTPFDTNFVVSSIDVQGQGGADSIITLAGTLQMEAMVMPNFAADTTVSWSVPAGNGIATISATGLLTAVSNGSVVVTATANDGTGISGTDTIHISNQDIGLKELNQAFQMEIFPNPAHDQIQVKSPVQLDQIELYTLNGQLLMETKQADALNISNLAPGTYLLRAFGEGESASQLFVKH